MPKWAQKSTVAKSVALFASVIRSLIRNFAPARQTIDYLPDYHTMV